MNFAQSVLPQRSELAVGELRQKQLALLFRAEGVFVIAVRLFHLLVVDVADLLLRFGRLFERRIKEYEIFIFRLRLGHSVRTTFTEPAIGNCQLCLSQEFACIVGVHQRVERDARDLIPPAFDIGDGFIEQYLVWLLRVLRDWVFVLLPAEAAGERESDQNEGEQIAISIHNTF